MELWKCVHGPNGLRVCSFTFLTERCYDRAPTEYVYTRITYFDNGATPSYEEYCSDELLESGKEYHETVQEAVESYLSKCKLAAEKILRVNLL